MNREELVNRLREKDIMAFETLYDTYWENVCGVINTIVRDKSLAENISQDVFTKVWNDSHNYNPSKGRFFSWLLRLARKAAFDEIHSKSSETEKKNRRADYVLRMLNEGDPHKSSNNANNLKKLAKNVEKKNIEIIDLLYFKGYSQREASEALGINPRKVKKRNRSSISQIRENMTFEWM